MMMLPSGLISRKLRFLVIVNTAGHGLGKRKAKFLPIRYSAEEIESIKAVKRRLHPNASLGRGTFFVQS